MPAISRPSNDALDLIHCEAHDILVDDCINNEDISLSLGITDHGSVWPTLNLWDKNENWSGEWSKKCKWFTSHIREIARCSPLTILIHQQWKATVCHHTVTAFKSHWIFGTKAYAAGVSELETLFPPPEPLMLESPWTADDLVGYFTGQVCQPTLTFHLPVCIPLLNH